MVDREGSQRLAKNTTIEGDRWPLPEGGQEHEKTRQKETDFAREQSRIQREVRFQWEMGQR